jgi:hypothetical protein
MARPRAADDFAAIRARMEELKREREQVQPSEDTERLDERRWRVADELRAKALARRNCGHPGELGSCLTFARLPSVTATGRAGS